MLLLVKWLSLHSDNSLLFFSFSYSLFITGIVLPCVSNSGDMASPQTLATTNVGISSPSSESIKPSHDLVLRQETANASLPIAVTHSDVSASVGEVSHQVSHLASHHSGQFTHCFVVDLC